MTISEYLSQINKRYSSGISREHSYRGDLETLLRHVVKGVDITNEPANVTNCGNPDYVITKGQIPVGYIEAKDIGKDLNHKQYKEQFGRYKRALDNLVITDYLWFQFFQNGELVHEIRLAEIIDNTICPIPENFTEFENRMTDFCTYIGQTIRSSKKLAEMMAAKARLLQNILEKALSDDEQSAENTSLRGQFETFKEILIHDLDPKAFADIYAQTLAYGMFAARLHDPTPEDFSRYEAAELIPKTNPFLKKLFTYVAGPDIDERLKRTVDNLAYVFRASNVKQLLQNHGKSTQMQDPIIHFYETFLAAYDPKLRKARGVWYTPQPVVQFIVRAVDDILKTEFNLPQGLADTTKTKIKLRTQTADKRTASGYKEVEQEVHKVQILDPATGTGTFLAEVVKHIYGKKFKSMQGAWSTYVDEHLIPRLNGFELLMASYAMAHLKLDMLLTDTGYVAQGAQKRFNIYLTNSLEEHHPDTGTIFSNWLSTEANEANHIKRDNPVMVVMGNPPYSGESANKGDWIKDLMDDYKKEPGGKEKLKERNPKWINDDYVKFLRYGQHYIEKNGSGVVAFINPHGFLDNPTFRGMRWNLLKTYDKIYTIDLHGNSKKKEVCPDGSPDVNVFDIMQGVSINILIKTGVKKNNELGKVLHYDLFGKRDVKYSFLLENYWNAIPYLELPNIEPNYFFVPKDFKTELFYRKGFSVNELFVVSSIGIVTARDKLTIKDSKEEVITTISDFVSLDVESARQKYSLGKDARDWKVHFAQNDLKRTQLQEKYLQKIAYRPFDSKWTYYTGNSKGFHCMPRGNVMKHLLSDNNFGIVTARQCIGDWRYIFVTNIIGEFNLTGTAGRFGSGTYLPLYLYPETTEQQSLEQSTTRTPNLNPEIVNEIAEKLGLTFVSEKDTSTSLSVTETFAPIDILDYIYAVLHSPAYRAKYKEFLKIDFPRVPYPKNPETFWQLVELGGRLRQIHLLESPVVENPITSYPEAGNNVVEKPLFKISPPGQEGCPQDGVVGKVYINNTQYFADVPKLAWEFYIGGYQPAQKWLKDRKGRPLEFADIEHYQKIIVALSQTKQLMHEIDGMEIE